MIRWERLALLRTPALLLAAVALIVTGVFQISTAAGLISLGVALGLLAFLFDATSPVGQADAARTQGVYR
jgi:hypothetical protein